MRILLTNDDGLDGPGLAALQKLAEPFGELVVCAPATEQSSCGHRATFGSPIRIDQEGPESYRVHGSPVDCVRIALTEIAPDCQWVLAGINPGGNLGVDVFVSGTVAAAREATILGRQAIALSHYMVRGRPLDWELAIQRLQPLIQAKLEAAPTPGHFWNINLPHPDSDAVQLQVRDCQVDPAPLDVRFAKNDEGYTFDGNYHQRKRTPGHDVALCFDGEITQSLIRLAGS